MPWYGYIRLLLRGTVFFVGVGMFTKSVRLLGVIIAMGALFGIYKAALSLTKYLRWDDLIVSGLFLVVYAYVAYVGFKLFKSHFSYLKHLKWLLIAQIPVIKIEGFLTYLWSSNIDLSVGWLFFDHLHPDIGLARTVFAMPTYQLDLSPPNFFIGIHLLALVLAVVVHKLQLRHQKGSSPVVDQQAGAEPQAALIHEAKAIPVVELLVIEPPAMTIKSLPADLNSEAPQQTTVAPTPDVASATPQIAPQVTSEVTPKSTAGMGKRTRRLLTLASGTLLGLIYMMVADDSTEEILVQPIVSILLSALVMLFVSGMVYISSFLLKKLNVLNLLNLTSLSLIYLCLLAFVLGIFSDFESVWTMYGFFLVYFAVHIGSLITSGQQNLWPIKATLFSTLFLVASLVVSLGVTYVIDDDPQSYAESQEEEPTESKKEPTYAQCTPVQPTAQPKQPWQNWLVFGNGFYDPVNQLYIPNQSDYDLRSPLSANGLALVGGGTFSTIAGPRLGGYGYINTQGNLAIEEKYKHAKPFTENGLAAVELHNHYDGYINAQGQMVIPAQFYDAGSFAENGLARVQQEGNGEWGYINDKGEMVIPAQFSEASDFAENGLAAIKLNDYYGYINTQGEMVIPTRFYDAGSFSANGLAKVKQEENGKYGYINAQGEMLIPAQFYWVSDFAANGLASVQQEENGKYGYINAQGEMLIPAQFDHAATFAANGLASVQQDDKYGYIDCKGKFFIPPQFTKAHDFDDNGLAWVSLQNDDSYIEEQGLYINSQGQIVVQKAEHYCGTYAVLNSNGVVVWPKESEAEICDAVRNSGGW